jgi:hypothetical protein
MIPFLDIMEQFQEYADLLNEFMSAVKQAYGEKVLVQVEFMRSA